MPKISFKNGIEVNDENYKRAIKSLGSTANDLEFYMKYSSLHENDEVLEFISMLSDLTDLDDIETAIANWKNLGPFNEYGLCFDYVAKGTFQDQDEGYYRYQFSWGGPSDELRLYESGFAEYVWMDWGIGVGFDVSNEEWVEWIRDWFDQVEMIDWDKAREEDNDSEMDEDD